MTISNTLVTHPDYPERVYAGVLGKIIGVYLGRPFEGWHNPEIESKLGEINYYVHEKLGQPLVVADDDISGTFTFLRALSENGFDPNITPAQIGDWWLNTIIENRTILWWGGLGLSTEHTAYLRLKAGYLAPESGSIALNGVPVAEEIGAQIFIDGWGLICPGDPERAADFARRAASVSHDGEAIYGAQVIAALVALAFAETDLHKMLTTARALVPKESMISALIADMERWAAENGDDWRATLAQIHAVYPYSRFGTNCPMVSNHAIILLALLHGHGEFQRSLMIANTAGYDTDCNSGNLGCILGVLLGLPGIDIGPDWRGPVADRLYLPTADGGRAITDAVRETYEIVNTARVLQGEAPLHPKDGARFHFSLPGSVQGFRADESAETRGAVTVGSDAGRLALTLSHLTAGRAARVGTPTFTPPESFAMPGYEMAASPTLYSGQTVTAHVAASPELSGPVQIALYVKAYGPEDSLVVHRGAAQSLAPERDLSWVALSWVVPDLAGQPVAEVGLELTSAVPVSGPVLLDRLTWSGAPEVTLGKPEGGGKLWEQAWVNGADRFHPGWTSEGYSYRIIQNAGTGLVSQGTAEWTDYTVSVPVRTHLAKRIGLAACVRGLRRYVALVLDADKKIRLIRQHDREYRVLAESSDLWQFEQRLTLSLTVSGGVISARAGETELTAPADGFPLSGAVGLLVDEGHAEFGGAKVRPQR